MILNIGSLFALGGIWGPETASLSPHIQADVSGAGIPEHQVNYWLPGSDSAPSAIGSITAGQSDKDVPYIGCLDTFDATNVPTQGGFGRYVQLHFTVPSGTANTIHLAFGAGALAHGAGSIAEIAGIAAANTNAGSGVVGTSYTFFADTPNNLGSGSFTDIFGYFAADLSGIATGHSAQFEAAATPAIGDNWQFFGEGGKSKFDIAFINLLTLTAPTPTGTVGQVSFGTTTDIVATAGVNGATPAQVAGYLVIDIDGKKQKIAYYNV